ncbi:MAG: transcription antitermination factor NusB [Spirochaetales bacterium]|nr:transcription antitermination factor NusB [Spirochaetales bacterium]
MGARRKARILAFQSLFAHELTGGQALGPLEFPWVDPGRLARMGEDTLGFAHLLVQGTLERLADVDLAIKRHLEHWDFSRLNKVDQAILRISAYCLLFQQDIPASVTIDEAIDIAKEYGTDDSYRFINGVLDGIRKEANP